MPVISTHSLTFDPQISIFSTLEPIKTALLEITLWILQTYIPKATEGSRNELRDLNLPFPGCLSFSVSTPSHNPNTWHNISAKPAIRRRDPHRRQLSLSDWLLMHRGEKRKGRLLHISSLIIHSFTHTHPPTANAASILTRAEHLHSFQLTTGFE